MGQGRGDDVASEAAGHGNGDGADGSGLLDDAQRSCWQDLSGRCLGRPYFGLLLHRQNVPGQERRTVLLP